MSMDVLEGDAEGVKDYNLERLIMLSDGVFAIALTLTWPGAASATQNAVTAKPPPTSQHVSINCEYSTLCPDPQRIIDEFVPEFAKLSIVTLMLPWGE